MYTIQELEYLLGFMREGIAKKEAKINALLTEEQENISDGENNNVNKLKNKILEYKLMALGFQKTILEKKIMLSKKELRKIELEKKPLLKEATLLIHGFLSNDFDKVKHTQLTQQIVTLENAEAQITQNLNTWEIECLYIIREQHDLTFQQKSLSGPEKTKLVSYHFDKQGLDSNKNFPGSPPIHELLGLDQDATLEDMLQAMRPKKIM
jgi:hypothetical protein